MLAAIGLLTVISATGHSSVALVLAQGCIGLALLHIAAKKG